MQSPTQPQQTPARTQSLSPGSADGDWCATVVDMVRQISMQTDPQAMISVFRKLTQSFLGGDRSLSLSRRDLEAPQYRITRSSQWSTDIDPWADKDRLPLHSGGPLADLLYGAEPRIIKDFDVPPNAAAFEYLEGMRSILYLPLFDEGVSLNAVVRLSASADAFDAIDLANALLMANLFGRATGNLLVARDLRSANAELDREMKQVANIQRALLPKRLPTIASLDIAASYKPAARAGGDYYDFFELANGRWGVLIADVSGHGTPAAVVMAMLRTMLHQECKDCTTPGGVLQSANRQLCNQSDDYSGTFVTAFYGVYDPSDHSLHYACAGHNPPLLIDRKIQVRELDDAQSLPLAVDSDPSVPEGRVILQPGDTLLLYTDGITEAVNTGGEQYGLDRLLSCVCENVLNAQHIIDCVTHKLLAFTSGGAQLDDQTLLALRVS